MEIKQFKKRVAVLLLLLAIPFMQVQADGTQNQSRDTYIGTYNEVFAKAYAHYQQLKGHKTFALAIDARKNWVYGLGHNYSLQTDANRRALFECNSRLEKFNVETSSCRLYALGDKIVW